MKIRKCSNGHYTMKDTCPECSNKTKTAHPARFAAADKYGKYRRIAKERINTGKTE